MAAGAALRIDRAETRDFALLSGDFNPLHLDDVQARRLMFGGPVTHGPHVLLRALDRALTASGGPLSLTSLKASFAAPIVNDQEFILGVDDATQGRLRLAVTTAQGRAQTATACFVEAAAPERPVRAPVEAGPCRDLSLADAAIAEGAVALAADQALLKTLFPTLARRLPARQIAAILAASRIVGMECPGRHSLFARLALDFSSAAASDGDPLLSYRVEDAAQHHALFTLAVEGPGVSGLLTAFYRPPPTAQPTFEATRAVVTAGEFAGQKALVIGGSRGLGEVTAKLIAAGGGETRITYLRGREDALRVANEITAGGGECRALPFDALDPASEAPEGWLPSHVYYFATPFIAANKSETWDAALFERLRAYYVDGLAATVAALLGWPGIGALGLFYPSTVFIDRAEPGMAEYAAAKEAGERMCGTLAERHAGLRCACPRLPRMATDQTGPVVAIETEDSLPVMLAALRGAG